MGAKGCRVHRVKLVVLENGSVYPENMILLVVPSISILNPGIQMFLENLKKPRENKSSFEKNDG